MDCDRDCLCVKEWMIRCLLSSHECLLALHDEPRACTNYISCHRCDVNSWRFRSPNVMRIGWFNQHQGLRYLLLSTINICSSQSIWCGWWGDIQWRTNELHNLISPLHAITSHLGNFSYFRFVEPSLLVKKGGFTTQFPTPEVTDSQHYVN